MSDEIKNPDPVGTPENADTPAGPSEALQGELNGLRELFQREWDKSMEEAEHPHIQGLEYEPEPEEEPEEEPQDAPVSEPPAAEKKPKKKAGKVLLIVLIVLLVLILIPLIAYFVISIKVPSFNNFMSAYTNAAAAAEPADKITYLNSALEYCEEGTFLDSMRQSIQEDIAVYTCEAQGYAAAKSYIDQNFTEEMLAKPVNKEFGELLAVGEKVQPIADRAYDAVKAAFDAAADKDAVDYDAVADSLGVPALLKKDVTGALQSIGDALKTEADLGTDVTEEQVEPVMTAYLSAVQTFKGLGASAQTLLETAVAKLYNYGFVYETTVLIDNYFDEDMLAAPKTDAFTEVLSHIDALGKADVDVYAVAQGLYENNTVSDDEIKNALNVSLPDAETAVLVNAAKNVIEGLKAEEEKNLPAAAKAYTAAFSTLDALELETTSLAGKLITLNLQLGNENEASNVRDSLPDSIPADNEALAAVVTEIDAIVAARSAAEEVFYPYYYNYYYGTAIDKAELNGKLDALVTEEADDYTKAYVNYFKFFGENFTDADPETMQTYLEAYADVLSDYPAMYASLLGEVYKTQGAFDKAEALADRVLEVNEADDYANAVKSFAKRASLNVDEALAVAQKGIELSGSTEYSAREALICSLLKEDYSAAFDYAVKLFDANLTYDNVDYIMLITSLYESDNADEQAKLDEYREKAENVMDQYSLEVGEKAQSIIDGTLTMVKVFMEEPYYLR